MSQYRKFPSRKNMLLVRSRSRSPVNRPEKKCFHNSSRSPLRRSSKSPIQRLPRSPLRRFSKSPTLRRCSRSPLRLSSRSPLRKTSRSPLQWSSKTPLRQPSRSPVRWPSRSTPQQPSRSPLRRPQISPLRCPSRSPLRWPSRSPPRRPSRSPLRRPSRSPLLRPSRSPSRHISRSPLRRPSRSPQQRPSRSPLRWPSRSPLRQSSRSPLLQSSRSSLRQSSRSPLRQLSRSPLRQPSRSPLRRLSRSPLRFSSRSPLRRVSKSPLKKLLPCIKSHKSSQRRSSNCLLKTKHSKSPLKKPRQSPVQKTARRTSQSPSQRSLGKRFDKKDETILHSTKDLNLAQHSKISPEEKDNDKISKPVTRKNKIKESISEGSNLRTISKHSISNSLKPPNIKNYAQKENGKKDKACESVPQVPDSPKSSQPPELKQSTSILNSDHNKLQFSSHAKMPEILTDFISLQTSTRNKHHQGDSKSLETDPKVTESLELLKPIQTTCSDNLKSDCTKTQFCSFANISERLKDLNSLQNSSRNLHTDDSKFLENSIRSSLIIAPKDLNEPAQSNEISSSIISCEITTKTKEAVATKSLNGCESTAIGSAISEIELSSTEQQPSTEHIVPSYELKNIRVAQNEDKNFSEESKLIDMNPELREFDILDDLDESEHDDDDDDKNNAFNDETNSSEYETDNNEEIPVDDIDAMLEENLPDKFKEPCKKNQPTKLRRKTVLEEIGHDHFDLLPEGWIQIIHSSGMPVYLHQKSRVCTMTRPYYLGPGSSRNHKVPLSAIPCLQYKRALEMEKKKKEEKENNIVQNQDLPDIKLMSAHIETFEENKAAQSLEISDLNDYCKKVFNFKTITLIPFKSWAHRRKFSRSNRDLKKRQRPSLPGGTKLLKFPVQNADGVNCKSGEWIINPSGKSYVCILHEYVQHALRKHPKYRFSELENPATPYSATVFIEDLQYGIGVGASKKQAKVEAAKAALEVLIPEMKEKIERESQFGMSSGMAKRSEDKTSDISIFDQIRVEDPRVAEFCAKSTEPPPYAILLTCLSRNMGLGEIKVNYEMNSKHHKQDEFTMIVGNHKATVVCKNKREGKQRAAQAILQALHPNITHWGSLLRMYGNRSIKNVKEKKQEEQEITGLQSKASLNQPNYAILEKLCTEMFKLKEKREAMTAKGKFTLPENIILPSLSSTDLNKVNLL